MRPTTIREFVKKDKKVQKHAFVIYAYASLSVVVRIEIIMFVQRCVLCGGLRAFDCERAALESRKVASRSSASFSMFGSASMHSRFSFTFPTSERRKHHVSCSRRIVRSPTAFVERRLEA